MGNKLRHEGDEVRIKVIWPDFWHGIFEEIVCIHNIKPQSISNSSCLTH